MTPEHHLKIAESLSKILDDQFSILGIKFGLDPILDIIPIGGDVIGLILSSYIVWIGVQMKIPSEQISRMISNIILDFIIGIIPLIGPVGDLFFKSNKMNMEILRKYAKSGVVEGKIV